MLSRVIHAIRDKRVASWSELGFQSDVAGQVFPQLSEGDEMSKPFLCYADAQLRPAVPCWSPAAMLQAANPSRDRIFFFAGPSMRE